MSKKVRECITCGKEFTSYNPNPKFCSRDCRTDYMRHKIPIDRMIELYEKGLTQEEVAEKLGTSQKVIWKRMKEIGYEARVAAKRNQYGSNNDSWKGGRVFDSRGYVLVKTPNHPRAKRQGDYVFEHILAVEKEIGRYLNVGEIIHHINGIKDDNRLNNLYITNPSEHSSMHNNGWSHLVKSNLEEYKEED